MSPLSNRNFKTINNNASDKKFIILQQIIRDRILRGIYKNGEQIPTEGQLCKEFNVSRVTVRKALNELKKEGIIQSTRGSGTIVAYRIDGFQGQLHMVAMLAPIRNTFIGDFFQHFEEVASKQNTFMVLSFDLSGRLTKDVDIYRRFLNGGIRDFVLWPAYGFESLSLLECLRGLGVNFVLFDQLLENPYADCVLIDNRHAITTLVDHVRKQGCRSLHYIGYDDNITFAQERLKTFRSIATPQCSESLVSIKSDIDKNVRQLVANMLKNKQTPDAFICVNSYIARSVAYVLTEYSCKSAILATVEDMREIPGIRIVRILHPLKKLAQTAFDCLVKQNKHGKNWKAGIYRVQGKLATSSELWNPNIS